MNEKLIRRAAAKYRDWMLSQVRSPVQSGRISVLDTLNRMNNKAAQMQIWAERFFGGSTQRLQRSEWDDRTHKGLVCPSAYARIATTMIPELSEDVVYSAKHAAAVLKSLEAREVVTVISPKEAIDELRAIVGAWSRVEFRGNVLSVTSKDITLYDDDGEVNLGRFTMSIDLTYPLDSLRIGAVDGVKSTGGLTHPHVSGGKLCIGAGGLPSQDALCQGRLEDFFRVIEAVLDTYNDASPHEALREWYDPDHEGEFFCESCEEWRSDESSCYCGGCDHCYCEYCDAGGGCCAECGDWRCGECSTTCHGCEETLCNGCGGVCHGCGNSMCSSCVSECTVCRKQYCEECKSTCDHCGDSVCENCTSTCGCCSGNCCNTCVNETCNECNQDICEGCQASCSECDKTVCNACNDNSCEHCGTPMCGSCECEHNCLLEGVESSTQDAQ